MVLKEILLIKEHSNNTHKTHKMDIEGWVELGKATK